MKKICKHCEKEIYDHPFVKYMVNILHDGSEEFLCMNCDKMNNKGTVDKEIYARRVTEDLICRLFEEH